MKKITYNSPAVLTFALVSLVVLLLDMTTGGRTTRLLFSVYRAPLGDPLTYARFFGHVLGHSGYAHYLANMLLFLVVGPPLEEKYGGTRLLVGFAVTALVTGLLYFVFSPREYCWARAV